MSSSSLPANAHIERARTELSFASYRCSGDGYLHLLYSAPIVGNVAFMKWTAYIANDEDERSTDKMTPMKITRWFWEPNQRPKEEDMQIDGTAFVTFDEANTITELMHPVRGMAFERTDDPRKFYMRYQPMTSDKEERQVYMRGGKDNTKYPLISMPRVLINVVPSNHTA